MGAASFYKEADIRLCLMGKDAIHRARQHRLPNPAQQQITHPFNMNFFITVVTMLASLAVASPANLNDLEARVDCSTCGCSSAESCTVRTPSIYTIKLMKVILISPLQFDVSLHINVDCSNCQQKTNMSDGLSVAK